MKNMGKYLVTSHSLKLKDVLAELNKLEKLSIISSEEVGEASILTVETEMQIPKIYEQIKFIPSQLTISPMRKYRLF